MKLLRAEFDRRFGKRPRRVVEDGQPYMVFCHEWCQMKDGRMCYAPLAPDFASFTAVPTTIFKASDAMKDAGVITDGPFLYHSPKSGVTPDTISMPGRL